MGTFSVIPPGRVALRGTCKKCGCGAECAAAPNQSERWADCPQCGGSISMRREESVREDRSPEQAAAGRDEAADLKRECEALATALLGEPDSVSTIDHARFIPKFAGEPYQWSAEVIGSEAKGPTEAAALRALRAALLARCDAAMTAAANVRRERAWYAVGDRLVAVVQGVCPKVTVVAVHRDAYTVHDAATGTDPDVAQYSAHVWYAKDEEQDDGR